MSFFTNPFANQPSSVPVFASSPLNPIPSPPIAGLRRSSLVRAAAPDNNNNHSAHQPHIHSTTSSSGVSFISPFAKQRAQSPARPSGPAPRRASLVSIHSPATPATTSHSQAPSPTAPAAAPKINSPQLRRASIGVATGSSPPHSNNSPSIATRASPAPAQMTPTAVVFSVAAEEGALGPTPTSRFLNQHQVDLRRRSVDVGVLGLGTHRMGGVGAVSRRVRDAVGPDAGDKEYGLTGSAANGKDRM